MPKTYKMVRKRSYSSQDTGFGKPAGSWETAIWEKGRVIGYWLNYQFDPNAQESYDEDLYQEERFRPVGSDKWILPP